MAGPKTIPSGTPARFRAGPGAPVTKTLPAGQSPRASTAQGRTEAIQERSTPDNIERVSRALRDAGLSYRARDQAMDLYLMHGTPPEAAIAAVGGRRMSVENARAIERALLPRDNPNDDRAYFHALDLHAAGQPIGMAILNANAEAATHNARMRAMRVQEHPAPARAPLPPTSRRRDFQTPEQHRENAADNRAAVAGIGIMLALFAGMAWLLFSKPSAPPTTPPTQPGPPVKPTAPPTQPPKSQPPPPVKRKAWPQR